MNDFRADLHCHSTCSDGSETPEQLITLAKKSGLSALSITDHDTVEAYKTVIPFAEKEGIQLLTGVEFSTMLNQQSVHILGYGFDPHDSAIAALCHKHITRRKERNLAIIAHLNKQGMPLTYEDILEPLPLIAPLQEPLQEPLISDSPKTERSIGRPHIAFAMIKKGYVSTPQEAFNKYLGEKGSCFVQGSSFSVDETLDTIHQAKGIAVIAHPHLIKNTALLNLLLKKEFDGMECYYAKFLSSEHMRWLKIAKHRNWLITGGSDFHGLAKPNQHLGCSWIAKEPFEAILHKLSTKKTC